MKVFLTGTSGLLGSNVLIALQRQNYEVKALFRNEDDARRHREVKDVELFMGDITDAAAMQRGVAGCDVIIHAAADTGLWPSRCRTYEQTNVQGTVNLIEAGKKANVQRMISVSTANALGFGTKEHPGSETSLPQFAQYGLGYMETKYLAQEVMRREARNGFPGVVVNPTFMIGPHDHKPSSGRMVLAVYEGKVPGYPVGGKNYVYVGDAATAIVNAIEQARIGECYILGNENLSYQEAFTKMAKVIGVAPPRFAIPPGLTKGFGFFGSVYGTVAGKAPSVSYKMAQVSCDGHYFTAAKAVRELGMPQTSIDVAIQECFQWFKENDYLRKKR
ncbi:MAG: NAD-dependent epimerase/dehydratase family protein [Tunicatimonas sp.]